MVTNSITGASITLRSLRPHFNPTLVLHSSYGRRNVSFSSQFTLEFPAPYVTTSEVLTLLLEILPFPCTGTKLLETEVNHNLYYELPFIKSYSLKMIQ
ncbi:hypothetical protein Lalb_Chr02g0148531 [Lupinus albus]|uniref:Uncharacterized protein n=1 Tax=Lupinus albus TaxID=3870 RepID=A0A6A4QVU5_LUPAL|nr:hypothetical protein Lalb_Chr02g0148531 [Lupinus albus]